ncbi:MAG: DNA mismatch repair protein MutS [Alphaproteobacteria bacterium]|nr:DNA mismatch repair protein MutS [Alphaproteobacteria bacterium]
MNQTAETTPNKTQKSTPMMEQYFEIKRQNEGYLLFYRMGDFYEMFFDDAIKASAALDIALTKRNREKGQDVPMCGVPVHSHEIYLSRLIKKGFKVAICEQMEDPVQARKERGSGTLVKREVIRLITPGTLTEDNILEPRSCNYLLSLTQTADGIGMAWVDVSTGDFAVQTLPDKTPGPLSAGISRLEPKEIIVSDKILQTPEFFELFNEFKRILTPLPAVRFSPENGQKRLEKFFNVQTLDAFGHFNKCELGAAGALVDYIELTQKGQTPRLNPLKHFTSGRLMEIDTATRRNLELFHSLCEEKGPTLFSSIDKTVTGSGARLLSRYLSLPLTDVAAINKRLDRIEFFIKNPIIRATIRDRLAECPDMERALARLSLGRGGPRDLAAIRDTLKQIPDMKLALHSELGMPSAIENCLKSLNSLDDLTDTLCRALAADLPLLARDGGFIAPMYCAELDEVKRLRDQSRQMIIELQAKYTEIAGVSGLKISHNNLMGYFIEVSAKNAQKILEEAREGKSIFMHRQTMANAVRFTTVELSEMEDKLRGAAEKALVLELNLFTDLVNKVMKAADQIARNAQILAVLDVAAGLAQTAEEHDYCRPVLEDSLAFDIVKGRHPVVEQTMKAAHESGFITNDCHLGNHETKDGRLWLITGPNMAGKSTFLRQNALIAILAQAGCYVPAQSARIGIVDKLFSRVGAADDLARGRSTFMVEMIETAAILNQSTERSLVILDEIGRGTATFDGLSIAWAVVEHLHDVNKSRALFATHYHELTALTEMLAHLSLYTMRIKEWKGNVIFLHEVIKGTADRSYGIHVGRLAGLPPAVIARAGQVLEQMEKQGSYEINFMNDLPLFALVKKKAEAEKTEPEKISEPSPVVEALNKIIPDNLTPRQALDELYRLKQMADQNK